MVLRTAALSVSLVLPAGPAWALPDVIVLSMDLALPPPGHTGVWGNRALMERVIGYDIEARSVVACAGEHLERELAWCS